jgi:hypothetical protein
LANFNYTRGCERGLYVWIFIQHENALRASCIEKFDTVRVFPERIRGLISRTGKRFAMLMLSVETEAFFPYRDKSKFGSIECERHISCRREKLVNTRAARVLAL